MKAKYPYIVTTLLPFKTGKKLKSLTKNKNISLSKAVRGIIEKYFELNPSEGKIK